MSSMQQATRVLFGFAMLTGSLALIAALLGIELSQAGIVMHPNWADAPLLVGLLVLFIGNYNYYTRIIEPAGESPAQTLLSLAGMIVMAALPIIVLSAGLVPLRYVAIAVYGVLVIAKNRNLSQRFAAADSRRLYRIWTRRAMLQTAACLCAAAVYFVLMHPASRLWVFGKLLDSSRLNFKPAFDYVVSFTFGLCFMSTILALFLMHQKDVTDLKGPGSEGLGSLKPVANAIPPTGRRSEPRDDQ